MIVLCGYRDSSQVEIGKQICPIVLVVVSRSGSCEPIRASPNVKGSAVLRMREVPATAIVA